MEILLYIFLLLPLPVLLNRWRGTGNIYKFVTGTMLYALYLGLLIGSLCFANKVEFTLIENILSYMFDENIILSNLTNSVIGFTLAIFLFLIGECFAFGKWVGFLVDYEDEHEPEYESEIGKSFPYIHYLANYIVDEKDDYKSYCQIALFIRGFVWWTPLLVLLGSIDLLSWSIVAINSIILAIGFPFGCLIGRNWTFEYKSKYFFTKRGWGNQELGYGFIQFLCISFSIFLYKVV